MLCSLLEATQMTQMCTEYLWVAASEYRSDCCYTPVPRLRHDDDETHISGLKKEAVQDLLCAGYSD